MRRAVERFQVSPTNEARWSDRYREAGKADIVDRSSQPQRSPSKTPTRTERRVIKVQVIRRYEHPAPGDMIDVDIKKLGRIPAGGGWEFRGRTRGNRDYEQTEPATSA